MKKGAVLLYTVATIPDSISEVWQGGRDNNNDPTYRWYKPRTEQLITVAENKFRDKELEGQGWENKTILFYQLF